MEKLDLENVRIFTNAKNDVVDAINLIGQMVYASDDEDFRTYIKGKLVGASYIGDSVYTKYPFICGDERSVHYKYFILEKDAKFKEEKETKKLRPYNSISEFWNGTGCEAIGKDIITVRNKVTKQESVLLYIGYSNDMVHLGGCQITFKALFEFYEFYENYELYDGNYDGGEWLPFGIEVNE